MTTAPQRITLVTGGNKGLGKETVRRLIAEGHVVYLAARDADRGRQAARELGARPLVLDVTSDESVAAAAAVVQGEAGHLDVLVNNAAFVGALDTAPAEVTAQQAQEVQGTNVIGLLRVTQAFLALLEASAAPVVVNVSSGMDSLGRTTDPAAMESRYPSLAYASSKAAVNMLTVQYAKSFPRLRVNAVDPRVHRHRRHRRDGQGCQRGRRGRRPHGARRSRRPDRNVHRQRRASSVVSTWRELGEVRFISLTSYRKSGAAVFTPV